MIQRIKTHNILNGIKFSIAEFLFIPLLIIPFAIYYLTHARLLYGLVSVGILLNCLTVAGLGLRQLSAKVADVGLQQLLDKQARENIGRTNPHLLKDTLIITITVLLPYVLFVLVMVELLIGGRERRP